MMPDALVCCLSGIGNCISTIPLIKALKDIGYEVDMRIASVRGARPIFDALEEVRMVYEHGVTMQKYDVACCTHLCAAYHDGSCKVADRIMMIEPGLDHDLSPFSIRRYRKHEIEYCLDLARQLGFCGTAPRVTFPVEDIHDHGVGGRINPIAIGVGYHKGDDFSLRKHWGNENFASFVARVLKDKSFTPVFLGNEADRDNVNEILKMTEEKLGRDLVVGDPRPSIPDDVLVLLGQPLLEQIKAFVFCKMCLTNETMWTVASSAGVPCVSMVFKEAHHNPLKTYPYPSGVALVGSHSDMTPDVVHSAVQKVWSKGEPRRWARIVNVGDGTVSVKKSHLHTLRAGFDLSRPKSSVVALLFDGATESLFDVCAQCVEKVRATTPKDSEIILVLNSPTEKLRDLVEWNEKIDNRIVSVATNQNVGVVAKNLGYNLAQGEYILSIDSDVYVEHGWVEKMVGFLEGDPKAGLCAPCGGRLRVDRWGPEDWPCGDLGDEGPRSFLGYEDAEYFGDQTKTGKDGEWLDVTPSMCWCFRRKLLDKIGYLNWRFGPFVGSDADFCMRIKKAGYKVLLCRSPIRHMGCGGSTHAMFSDLEELRIDHIKELRKRWYPAAWKLCGLYPEVGGYDPAKDERNKGK